MSSKTKIIAFCSIMSALSIIFMAVGAFIPSLDMTAALFASLPIIVIVCVFGRKHALAVFLSSSLLGVILMLNLPNHGAIIAYGCFFGYYPILKSVIEIKIRKKWLAILVKFVLFTAIFAVLLFLAITFFNFDEFIGWYSVIIVALGEIAFVVYDIVLTKGIMYYFRFLRPRLRIERFFRK